MMKTDLVMDFRTDKENNSIYITREFSADIRTVWDAWTKSEILDRWWAPQPYHVETKSFDFSEGGKWLYAMVGPENDIHWSRLDFVRIEPLKEFVGYDAFSDENGNIDPKMPRSQWTNSFIEKDSITTVISVLKFDNSADLETLVKMGFKEGLSMGYKNLDEVLATL